MDMNDKSHLLNAYYTGNVVSWLKVQLDMDYAKGSSENHDFSVSEREDEVEVGTRSLQDYDLYAGKLTLSTPLLGSNFNYGMEYSHTTNEQTYWVDENEGAPSLASNENMSKQKLFEAFLSYSKSIDKLIITWPLNYSTISQHHLYLIRPVTHRSLWKEIFICTALFIHFIAILKIIETDIFKTQS